MKKSKMNIIRAMSFAAIFAVLAVLLGQAFVPKTSDPDGGIANANARGFYGEPENSIDVLVLGDSNAYSACSPLYMWKNYGIASYVAAEGYQSVSGAIGLLDEALSCQKPKVVVFDVNMLWTGKTQLKRIENNLKKSAYRAVPLVRYHDRWKTMKLSDIFADKDYTYRSASKGQYMSMDVKAYEGKHAPDKNGKSESIPEVSKYFLERLLAKCDANGIKVMFIETPTKYSWSSARHDAMKKYADARGIDFVDMNTLSGENAIDWKTDTRDGGHHMNCLGAEKVSAALGTYLMEHFDVSDRRSDTRYADWNTALAYYENYMSVSASH